MKIEILRVVRRGFGTEQRLRGSELGVEVRFMKTCLQERLHNCYFMG
jgi:hypothetical protein